jgi:outer membrane protein assembly factor BamB
MFPKIMSAAIVSLTVLSCSVPQPWNQFHGNGPNQGFMLVNSGFALRPKWSVPIGSVTYSSPAIGADGTAYTGTTKGELVAVSPNGNVRWKITPAENSAIVSSPAVGSDGKIYVISVPTTTEHYWSSTLHGVTPDGAIKWSRTFPTGFTTGSAKTWSAEGTVFVAVHITAVPYTQLVIFDQDGNEIHRENVCGAQIEGGYPIPSDWWKIFTLGGPFTFTIPPVSDPFGPLLPTVAIVDYSNLTPPNQPIIIVADNACGIRAYQWKSPNVNNLWNQFYRDRDHSSPAVDPGGTLIVGRDDGHVVSYDLKTGVLQWDYNANEPVKATPAMFGSYAFVVSLKHLHVVSISDGQILSKVDLGSTISSPAWTANDVYVSSSIGFYTFSADSKLTDIVRIGGAQGGLSSPAVAADGTVYMVTFNGFLLAFPPSP